VDLTATELEQALRTKRHVSVEGGNASLDFAAATWGSTNGDKSGKQRKNYAMPCDLSKALDAARASQKQKQAEADLPNSSSSAKVLVSTSCNDVAGLVIRWLKQVTSTDVSDTGLRCKNTKQIKVVQMIPKRVLQEHHDAVDNSVGRSKPLCALVIGGPGVGKSFVIKAARCLFAKLRYSQGFGYSFSALQAVVASQLDGETLHYLFALNMYGKPSTSTKKLEEVAARL
jgi:hypothetical protein